jgi:hypothetical protein
MIQCNVTVLGRTSLFLQDVALFVALFNSIILATKPSYKYSSALGQHSFIAVCSSAHLLYIGWAK